MVKSRAVLHSGRLSRLACAIVFFCLLYGRGMVGQVNPAIYQSFNTAVNGSGSGYSGLVPSMAADLSWSVSATFSVGYVPATHFYAVNTWYNTLPVNADWIISPVTSCPGTQPPPTNPGSHSCLGPIVRFYKIRFLVTNPGFVVNWDLFADDLITDVFVNAPPVNPTAVWSPNSGGFTQNASIRFVWCNWQMGWNEVIIRTFSAVGFAGLRVVSNPPPALSIMGASPVCANTQNTYSITPLPGVTGYSWTYPSGWSGPTSGTQVNVNAGTSSGLITVTPAGTNSLCLTPTTVAVTVIPLPVVNISASPMACPGQAVTLTASGANTYTWTQPNVPLAQVNQNVVTVYPTASTVYSVTGTGTGGCNQGTSITVNVFPQPLVSITSNLYVACSGIANTLTAVGNAQSYTWLPAQLNPLVVTPAPNSSYTVLATSANGCTNTAVITLPAGVTIPLSTTTRTLCTDISPCITVSVSTPFVPTPSFTWQPSGGNLQTTSPICPLVNTVYTVSASSPVGCPSFTTLAVTVQTCCPPPVETFTLPAFVTCNTYFMNLAQYASTTGTFSGPGVVNIGGVDYFNPNGTLGPGVYTIAFTYTTAPFGCSYTLPATATIVAPPTLVIPNPVIDRCAYAPANTLSVSAPWAVGYIWGPPLSSGSPSVSVAPTITTTYSVWVISANSCLSPGVFSVNVNYTCCPQSSVATWVSAGSTLTAGSPGSTLTGPVYIDGDIVITGPGNFVFQTGDFMMANNVSISLQQNANLVLSDAHLYGCDQMWDGIIVQNGSNITSAPGPLGLTTLIEDAHLAIDLGFVNSGYATPLLDLDGVIFNRNEVSIDIHDSPLAAIPLALKSCVFTNRLLPSSTLSWPSSTSANPSGMRYATMLSLVQSLTPPFLISPSYPVQRPKSGSLLQTAIVIRNNNNVNGNSPSPGVSWGGQWGNEFNLFDCLKTGVYVENASLTTSNNNFQNMCVAGVEHNITSQMNARLSLTSPNSGFLGNHFWHNAWLNSQYWSGSWSPIGIKANNVFEMEVRRSQFMGHQSPSGANSGAAISIVTNRFDGYNIDLNAFYNQPVVGINMECSGGSYNVNGAQKIGVYAGNLSIDDNMFLPQSAYTVPTTTETMQMAIRLVGDSTVAWQMPGIMSGVAVQPGYISNNDMWEGRNGILVYRMNDYPLGIYNNGFNFLQSSSYIATEVGLAMLRNGLHKSVRENVFTVGGVAAPNNQTHLMYFNNNTAGLSVTCNTVIGGFRGFSFRGNNPAEWKGNHIYFNTVGLYLNANIGTQGAPGAPSGNMWFNCSAATQVSGVNPANSYLYVSSPLSNNLGVPPYSMGSSYAVTTGAYSCPPRTYVQRIAELAAATGETIEGTEAQIRFYPNPSSGRITLLSEHENDLLQVSIMDITGKTVYAETLTTNLHEASIQLPLPQGIYMVNVVDRNNKELHQKLIISK